MCGFNCGSKAMEGNKAIIEEEVLAVLVCFN